VQFLDEDGVSTLEKFAENYLVSHVLHILPSFLWALIAPLQLSLTARRAFPTLHRISGYVFLMLSMVMATSAIVMSLMHITFSLPLDHHSILTEDLLAYPAALAFMYSAYRALMYARAKKFADHRRWIIRHVAIGYGVSVSGFWSPP
jgi:hypothetical protein